MPVDVPEDVPEDVPAEDVEGVVGPDEELVIAEGAELGAAAWTGEAAAEGEAASTGAASGATEGATDGATDGEAAIEGAAGEAPDASDPDDPDPDEPDPDDAADPDGPDDPEDADDADPDGDDPAADTLEFDPDPDPDAPHLGPVGAVSAPVPNFSTEVPGSGNCTSAESTVSQSLVGMFALNIAGKDAVARSERSETARVSSRVAALFFDPPLTLIDAQFMYISRLPILLNQVQARVYDPGAIP